MLNEVIRDSKYAFTRTPRPLIPKRALRVKFRSPTIQYALVLAQVLVLIAVVVVISRGSALQYAGVKVVGQRSASCLR